MRTTCLELESWRQCQTSLPQRISTDPDYSLLGSAGQDESAGGQGKRIWTDDMVRTYCPTVPLSRRAPPRLEETISAEALVKK